MTDLDLSRDTYAAVAARRTQFDQLVWQVPVLSLTAQAFLFSIALSPAATTTASAIACVLSFLMTVLSLHLMVKHRQAEIADSQWLEQYERQLLSDRGFPWPMHGTAWSDYRKRIDRKLGPFGFLRGLNGFLLWSFGLAVFGVAAVAVLLLTVL